MASYTDDRHDADWCHAPFTRALHDKYLRLLLWRARYQGNAHMFEHSPHPEEADPETWRLRAHVARALAEEMTAQLEAIEAVLGYRPALPLKPEGPAAGEGTASK